MRKLLSVILAAGLLAAFATPRRRSGALAKRPATEGTPIGAQLVTAIRTACEALTSSAPEVMAVSVVTRVPAGSAVAPTISSVRRLASEYHCRARVLIDHGSIDVRIDREAPANP